LVETEGVFMSNWLKEGWQKLKRLEVFIRIYLFLVSLSLRIIKLFLVVFVYPVLPLKQNKIVFSSFYGLGYGDNGKYIAEAIHLLNQSYDIVWLLKHNNPEVSNFPNFIRVVRYNSLKGFYELITAKVWIDNCRKSLLTFKRGRQYYIQTWHSSLGIKKIEKDVENDLPLSYLYRAKRDSQMCDVVLAGSKFRYELFKQSFWYDGEVMKSGTPRCDMLFADNAQISQKVYQWFGLPSDCKVVLYAPTFRTNPGFNYELEFLEILKALERQFKGDWRFLLRLHPNVANFSGSIDFNDKLINATYYDDMQELISVSECLITDYSSVMFDMLLSQKPCFIHAVDYIEYLQNERDLYFNVKDLPIPFSTSLNVLLKNIVDFNKSEYLSKVSVFVDDINFYEDGAASKRVAQRIREVIES
jgi:CDP-glycerol glycerophosphotransferase